jgi:aquaporin Z
VTIAAALSGRLPARHALPTIAAQTAGATLGAALALSIANGRPGGAPGVLAELSGGVGRNSPGFYGTNAALVSEIGLSAILAFVLLGASARAPRDKTSPHVLTAASGGIALALVHLVGAPVTGMPANPARAVGVALLSPLFASRDLWVFVLGPIVGGAIAAIALRLTFGAAEQAKTNLPSAAPDERAR